MKQVHFLRQHGKFAIGDVAAFTPEEADKIVRSGAGRIVADKGELAALSKSRVPEAAPTDRKATAA